MDAFERRFVLKYTNLLRNAMQKTRSKATLFIFLFLCCEVYEMLAFIPESINQVILSIENHNVDLFLSSCFTSIDQLEP